MIIIKAHVAQVTCFQRTCNGSRTLWDSDQTPEQPLLILSMSEEQKLPTAQWLWAHDSKHHWKVTAEQKHLDPGSLWRWRPGCFTWKWWIGVVDVELLLYFDWTVIKSSDTFLKKRFLPHHFDQTLSCIHSKSRSKVRHGRQSPCCRLTNPSFITQSAGQLWGWRLLEELYWLWVSSNTTVYSICLTSFIGLDHVTGHWFSKSCEGSSITKLLTICSDSTAFYK